MESNTVKDLERFQQMKIALTYDPDSKEYMFTLQQGLDRLMSIRKERARQILQNTLSDTEHTMANFEFDLISLYIKQLLGL